MGTTRKRRPSGWMKQAKKGPFLTLTVKGKPKDVPIRYAGDERRNSRPMTRGNMNSRTMSGMSLMRRSDD